MIIIIIGLGNPGKKYQKTRHNLGFQVIEEFYRKNKDVHLFSNFRYEKKFLALISEGRFNNKKIILAKPQTFMNLSGKAIKKLIKNYYLNKAMVTLSTSLWVIHDDIDLPLGKIKISIGRGAAGHRGVESIIDELGSKNFVRFRVGIRNQELRIRNTEKFVLGNFRKKEEKIVKKVIKKTARAIEFALREGLEKAQSQVHK